MIQILVALSLILFFGFHKPMPQRRVTDFEKFLNYEPNMVKRFHSVEEARKANNRSDPK